MLVMNTKESTDMPFLWNGIWYRECIASMKRDTGAGCKSAMTTNRNTVPLPILTVV